VNTWSELDCVLGEFAYLRDAGSAWWQNQRLNRPDIAIGVPDGPTPLCPDCFSWNVLPEFTGVDNPRRAYAELSYYFKELARPAGVMEVQTADVENVYTRYMGIDGDCGLSAFFDGVHSAFANKPLPEVWQFWSGAVASKIK
jgi:hypothetical protein